MWHGCCYHRRHRLRPCLYRNHSFRACGRVNFSTCEHTCPSHLSRIPRHLDITSSLYSFGFIADAACIVYITKLMVIVDMLSSRNTCIQILRTRVMWMLDVCYLFKTRKFVVNIHPSLMHTYIHACICIKYNSSKYRVQKYTYRFTNGSEYVRCYQRCERYPQHTSKMFYIFVNQTRLMQLFRWKIKPLVPWVHEYSHSLSRNYTYTYSPKLNQYHLEQYPIIRCWHDFISSSTFFIRFHTRSHTRWGWKISSIFRLNLSALNCEKFALSQLAEASKYTSTMFNGLLTVFHWISGIKSFTRQCQI